MVTRYDTIKFWEKDMSNPASESIDSNQQCINYAPLADHYAQRELRAAAIWLVSGAAR